MDNLEQHIVKPYKNHENRYRFILNLHQLSFLTNYRSRTYFAACEIVKNENVHRTTAKVFCSSFYEGVAEGSKGENFLVSLSFWGRIHCLLLGCFVFRTEARLRKQPTLRDATPGFPAKWRLRKFHAVDASATRSDWLQQISHAARTNRSTTQI